MVTFIVTLVLVLWLNPSQVIGVTALVAAAAMRILRR